jgi:hypothetical protein
MMEQEPDGVWGSEVAGEAREGLALLADLEGAWLSLIGETGPVTSQRHVESLAARVAELLEVTIIAAPLHPNERPLRTLLDRCLRIEAEWDLDTYRLGLELATVRLLLPVLPLPLETSEDRREVIDALGVQVRFDEQLFAVPSGDIAEVAVKSLIDGEPAPHSASMWVELPVLRTAVRDHLTDALTTATVLTRSSESVPALLGSVTAELPPDRDVDTARAADRLLDLLTGLEHSLARRASTTRVSDGTRPGDSETTKRQAVLFDTVEKVRVRFRQTLPAGTLEPILLEASASTSDDPDGIDVLPTDFTLRLELTGGRRGQGVLEVPFWLGGSQRAVLLPHIADLWDDHIDSAIRRAHAVVPAVRRSPLVEINDPVPDIGPPIVEATSRATSDRDDVVPLPPEDAPF